MLFGLLSQFSISSSITFFLYSKYAIIQHKFLSLFPTKKVSCVCTFTYLIFYSYARVKFFFFSMSRYTSHFVLNSVFCLFVCLFLLSQCFHMFYPTSFLIHFIFCSLDFVFVSSSFTNVYLIYDCIYFYFSLLIPLFHRTFFIYSSMIGF